jgi:hypothetical protein
LVDGGNIPGDFDLRLERVVFLEVRLDLPIQLLRTIIPQVDIRRGKIATIGGIVKKRLLARLTNPNATTGKLRN